MTHPALDSLAELVVRPETAAATDLLAHVSACAHCRRRLASLARVQTSVQRGWARESVSEAQMQTIADYVDRRLPAADSRQVQQRLAANSTWMRAALHYAAAAVSRSSPVAGAGGRGSRSLWLQRLLAGLRFSGDWQPLPRWAAAVIALLAVPLLILVLRSAPLAPPAALALAPYQDNGQLQITTGDAPPGIGFFSAARDGEQRPFAGVSARVDSDGRLVLAWPAVVGALTYHLTLDQVTDAQAQRLAELTTGETQVRLALTAQSLQPGVRYQWELRGTLQDQRQFTARGGFVPLAVEQTR